MESVDILYFIEHKARELDIACAVKHLIQSRHNISIEIKSIVLDLDHTLAQFLPKVVVLPFCVSIKSLNLEKILNQWPNALYIDLAYEQLLGRAQKQFKAPADDFARNYVIHSAWGKFFKDFLIDNGVPDQNIVINGNPSYALYQEPYKNFYGNVRTILAGRFGLDPEKRWVFVPENYGWAFFENHMLRDRIKRGFDPAHAYQYRDFSVNSLRTATEWWCEGAILDGIELIVRPRPAVPLEMFIEKIQALAGALPEQLHIIKDGSVREWILASDLVFSSISTTLLEAAVANKSLYMLMPYSIPEFIHVNWNDLAQKVSTLEEFLQILTQSTLQPNWTPLQTWVKENMLSQGDPITNQEKFLLSVVNGGTKVPAPGSLVGKISRSTWEKNIYSIRKFVWNALDQSLYALRIKPKSKQWKPHKSDALSMDDVIGRVSRWKEILG